MAKVNAPLFSFNASGKLANSLVYFLWKGLDAVRSYVIPANPKTAAQTTQRGYFTAAVDKIHACLALAASPLDAADKAAYALLASTRAKPRTWFNEIVKLWVDCKVAGDVPVIYCDGTISDPTHDSFDCQLEIEEETGSQLAAGKFYFGTSKTALIHSVAATVTAGDEVHLTNQDLSAFLTAGEKYYMQFRPDVADPCEGANSGIYTFTAT
jgi:hypothetical protein